MTISPKQWLESLYLQVTKALLFILVKLRRVHACGVDCGEGKPLAMRSHLVWQHEIPNQTGKSREFEWENHRAKWGSVKNVHV